MVEPSSGRPSTGRSVQPRRLARNTAFTLVVGLFTVGFFARFSPGALASAIQHDISASTASIAAVTGIYFYVYTIFQIPAGALIDRYAPVRPLAIGALVSACGLIAYASASSIVSLAIGAALIGLGASTSLVGVMRSAALWFSPARFGIVSGIAMFIGNLGSAAAGAPLTATLTVTSWRTVLITIAIISVAIAIPLLSFTNAAGRWATSRRPAGTPASHGSPTSLGGLLRDRRMVLLSVIAVGTNSTFYAFDSMWGIPLMQASGASKTTASTVVTISMLAYGVASVVSGKVSDRGFTRTRLLIAIAGFSVLGWLAVLVPNTAVQGLGAVIIGVMAGSVVVVFAVLSEQFSGPTAGRAIGIVNTAVFLGVGILQQFLGALWTSLGAFSVTVTLFVCALAGGAAALLFSRTSRPQSIAAAAAD